MSTGSVGNNLSVQNQTSTNPGVTTAAEGKDYSQRTYSKKPLGPLNQALQARGLLSKEDLSQPPRVDKPITGTHVVTFLTSDKKGGALYTLSNSIKGLFSTLFSSASYMKDRVYDRILGTGSFGQVRSVPGVMFGASNNIEKAPNIAVKSGEDLDNERDMLNRVHDWNDKMGGVVEGVQPRVSLVVDGKNKEDKELAGTQFKGDLKENPPHGSDQKSKMISQLTQGVWLEMIAGVGHFDIKPENVFIDDKNNYYIADHGAAVDVANTTEESLFSCTPKYTDEDPIWESFAQTDATIKQNLANKAMCFQLGMTLYRAIVGPAIEDRAFKHDPQEFPILKTRRADIEEKLIKKGCSREDAQFINRLISPNRLERPTAYELLGRLPKEVKEAAETNIDVSDRIKSMMTPEEIASHKDEYFNFEKAKRTKES